MKMKEKSFFYETSSPDWYEMLRNSMRDNRNHPTDAEYCLWQRLRGRQLGYRFRRQHALLDFIADFVCLEKQLVLEVDGAYHSTEQQQLDDQFRTERLEKAGYTVMRFTNEEIFYDIESVLTTIKTKLNQ